jgi:hypothetical protein
VTAALTHEVVGPRPIRVPTIGRSRRIDHKSKRLDGYRLVDNLYRRRTLITDVDKRIRPFRSFGADTFTLIRERDRIYLAVGFTVDSDDAVGLPGDTCEGIDLAVLHRRKIGPLPCTPGLQASPFGFPVWLNMKAWSFPRQGIEPDPQFCGGVTTFIHARGSGNPRPLLRHWPSYINADREC